MSISMHTYCVDVTLLLTLHILVLHHGHYKCAKCHVVHVVSVLYKSDQSNPPPLSTINLPNRICIERSICRFLLLKLKLGYICNMMLSTNIPIYDLDYTML